MKKLKNEKLITSLALPVLVIDLYVQIALVSIFSLFIERGSSEQPHIDLLVGIYIPCIIWLVFREMVQALNGNPIEYISQYWNGFDILQILVVSTTILHIIDDGAFTKRTECSTLLVSTFVVWLQLLRVIGNLVYPIAVFNATMIWVSYNIDRI